MSGDELVMVPRARLARLEETVDGLRAIVEKLLAALTVADEDPVAESFRRFQRGADEQTGRG